MLASPMSRTLSYKGWAFLACDKKTSYLINIFSSIRVLWQRLSVASSECACVSARICVCVCKLSCLRKQSCWTRIGMCLASLEEKTHKEISI